MSLLPLSTVPALIDQVHDRLLAAIVDGTLAPGQRLTQESVAEMLGVSRQPVSHALQVLRRRGLLIESGKRGLMVAPVEAQRVRDLYQVREALDGLAASLAAQRMQAGLIGAGEKRAADKALADGLALEDSANIASFVNADVTFHAIIHRLSGNAAIDETVRDEWPHFMRSMGVALTDADMRRRVWREHAAILAAIWSGAPAQAEELARSHTRRAGEETASGLEDKRSVA
jgi:DNA-binding GntR family transcriptional regulator